MSSPELEAVPADTRSAGLQGTVLTGEDCGRWEAAAMPMLSLCQRNYRRCKRVLKCFALGPSACSSPRRQELHWASRALRLVLHACVSMSPLSQRCCEDTCSCAAAPPTSTGAA